MQPGQVIANRFVVERLAGSGGMGAVYRALDRQSGAPVAVKVLHGHGADHAARFAREARLLSELRHPGIVRYVDHGATDAGDGFLAMEWLEGEDLSRRLRGGAAGAAGVQSGGSTLLAVADALTLASRVAGALRVAHERGVVHRDLKPGNLFLEGGAFDRVKVLDFGIARVLEAPGRITVTGEMIGTPGYMAPEQARGEKDVDARADVFSLGCILFRCLSGRRAFNGPDPLSILLKTLANPVPRLSEIRGDVPPALDDLLDRMIAKLPAERPRDAGAVLQELEGITGQRPGPSRAPGLSRSQVPLLAPDACFVLARFPGGRLPEGLPREALAERIHAAEAAAAAKRALFDVLADGSLLVTAAADGPVAEQAAAAARCALALQPLLPGMALVIVAGAAEGPPVEEGVRILERTAAGTIGVDAASARLLEGRFDIGMAAGGFALAGERHAAAEGAPLRAEGADSGRRLEATAPEATAPEVDPTWSEPAARRNVLNTSKTVDDQAPTWIQPSAASPAHRGVERTWQDPRPTPPTPPAPPSMSPQSATPWPAPPPRSSGAPHALPSHAQRPHAVPGWGHAAQPPAPQGGSTNWTGLLVLGLGAVFLVVLLGVMVIVALASGPRSAPLPQREGSIEGPAR